MIPYFVLLGVIAFISGFMSNDYEGRWKNENILIFIIFIILVLFAGLRTSDIGTDTNNYVYFFNENATLNLFQNQGSYEQGFAILSNLAKNISSKYWSLLSLIAAVAVCLNIKTIRSLSKDFKISIFLYLCLGLYVFFFNGARQGLAISFFGVAIIAAYKRSLLQYILWILIACMFHRTALICLVFYPFFRNGFKFKNILLNLLLFSGVFFLVTNVINLEGTEFEKFETYIDRGALGGGGYTIYHTLLLGFFLFIRKEIPHKKRSEYDFNLNMIMIGSLIFLITFIFGLDVNIMRLSFYFLFGHIFIWPIIFKEVHFTKDVGFRVIFIIAHLFYFFMILSQAGLAPYRFNNSIFLPQYNI